MQECAYIKFLRYSAPEGNLINYKNNVFTGVYVSIFKKMAV